MQHISLPWTRIVTVALGAVALASFSTTAVATEGSAPPVACPDGAVTVIVDFTDLGGGIEGGCATDSSTGTAALTSAGFTEERAENGTICAINSLPSPCPAEFTGSYWSYWYAADGAWQAWMEGSDTAVPAAGGVEGWRYNDGSAAPGVDPGAVMVVDAGGSPEEAPVATNADVGQMNPWVVAVVGVAAIGAVLVLLVRLGRRGSSAHGPAGQD